MIQIKNLCKKYENNASVINALDNVDITLPDKGLVLVVGKNGSGKTTLLNMLGLIDTPDSGSILVDGQNILDLKGDDRDAFRASRISYIFQTINLLNSLTAKENVLLVNDDEKAVLDAFLQVEISSCADKFPAQMSQGQIQKVAIIRAMMCDTSILLADEPTSALDVSMKDSVVAQLKKSAQNKLVMVVTHDADLPWDADMIVRFEDGRASAEAIKHNEVDGQTNNDKSSNQSALVDRYKSRQVKPKLALRFGLRSIKKSLISSIVFAFFALISYVSFVLLLGCPHNDLENILTKVYDQNSNKYVIVDCYDETPDNCVVFSKFSNATFQKGYEIDDKTPLWYAAAGYEYIGHSGVVNQNLLKDSRLALGRLAGNSKEVVITDYLADCLVGYGAEGKKYSNYDEILSDGYITLEYGALQVQAKVVGIVETDASHYSDLKIYNTISLSRMMRSWRNSYYLSASSKLDGEFATFLYKYRYLYSLCYNDGSLDSEISQLSQSMSVSSVFKQGDYIAMCSSIGKDTNLNPDDIYSVGEGEAIVSLSTLIDADKFYNLVSDGISQGKSVSQVIQEYIDRFPSATVEIYGDEYTVGAYYDDFESDENDSKVYLPADIAEKIYDRNLSENLRGTYAISANGSDLTKLSEKYGSIFFPEYEIAVSSEGKYNMVFIIVMLASVGLLLLTAIFAISDVTMYCKAYSKQLAIMRCIGISNSSMAITVFVKYLIIMAISYALSFAVSLPLIFTLSNMVTAPYRLVGLITFSPWSILLSLAYIGVIFAIAYVFGLSKIKKRSLGAMLR